MTETVRIFPMDKYAPEEVVDLNLLPEDSNDEWFFSAEVQRSIEQLAVDLAYQDEFYLSLLGAISALTEVQQFSLVEHYLHGRTYEDIAQEKGTSKQAVYQAVDIATKSLSKNALLLSYWRDS